MVAERGKGVNVILKVLHQAGCVYVVERCQTAILIHLSDIWIERVEREERSKKKNGVCVQIHTAEGWSQ